MRGHRVRTTMAAMSLTTTGLTTTLAENDEFVRALHHGVKNNFQLIASLINLQKRMLSPERRGEVRFVEEHVQCMAAAYRIVTVKDGMVQVALRDLVSEAVDALRQIAGIGRHSVNVELPASDRFIRIEQAVTLGLYLAVLVPPYLDAARDPGGVLRVAVALEEPGRAVVSVAATGEWKTPSNPLLRRLATAYLQQLFAEIDPTAEPGGTRVRIRLLPLKAAHLEGVGPG
jgi:hypothetical protein